MDEDNNLIIHDHGVYLELHGPFPDMVMDFVEKRKNFSSRGAIFRWLNTFWPDWRDHLVKNEGMH